MISKVEEHRDMNWTTGAEQQGTISPGLVTRTTEYNYPLTAANQSGRTDGVNLTDAPTYTEQKESWAAADDPNPTITRYKIDQNSTPRQTNVILPNDGVSRQLAYNTPGQFTDGLVYEDSTYVPDPNGTYTFPDLNLIGNYKRIAKSTVTWQEGHYLAPRPTHTEAWDENNHKTTTDYTYDPSPSGRFNQVLSACDKDNSGATLRCTNTQYQNDPAYIGQFSSGGVYQSGRHIFNLVLSTAVQDPQGVTVSRTDYEYDNYQAQPFTNAPGVIQHLLSHNAYSTATQDGEPCVQWGPYYECLLSPQGNDLLPPPGCRDCEIWTQVPVYSSATDKRGNITKVTTYANAQTLDGPIYETRGYDITGNLVKSSSACCEQTTILYDDPATIDFIDTQYAYPVSQTRGAADPNSPHRITTSATYSFETGLIKTQTDANGRTSVNEYDPDTLRPVKSMSPTGAYTTISYDDAAMTIVEEVKEITGTGPSTAGKSKKYFNGLGNIRKEESEVPEGTDIVEIQYNKFGRLWKQSRPYRSGGPVYWTERFYDSQGRLIKIKEPDDSETKAFYNETTLPGSVSSAPGNTIRVMDAWGRERWGRYDQQGRLVRVVEPNPDKLTNSTGSVFAAGSLLTKYKYDTLGRLVETEQGAVHESQQGVQFRKFKYDDLGRLTRQKLAEQTATLNSAGNFVGAGAGAEWAEAFVYDSRSNLIMKTDPRGVKTHFSYQLGGGGEDPLNRLQVRTYDTSGPLQPGLTIHNTWGSSVSYEYMTTGDKSRIKKIITANILTEEYSYDSEGRVSVYDQKVAGREARPFVTSYLYDTLDRIDEMTYPEQHGTGQQRKIVKHSYDSASRLTSLMYGGVQHAGNISYNASDQTTSIKIGDPNVNPVIENYTFDPQTGLLTNQNAMQGANTLLNLSYEYNRGNSTGSLTGKTGHVTKIIDHSNTDRNREYEFDALGRLTKANGGPTGNLSSQTYTYDRYGNRIDVASTGVAADGSPMPPDGIPDLVYDNTSNRITTTGFEYDVAGNQTKAVGENGLLKFEYDAANRLVIIKNDADDSLVQAFGYGSTNARLMDIDYGYGLLKIFASVGGKTLAEYTEFAGLVPTWTKTYTYLGDSQLATITPSGTEFNHPDKLSTRMVTDQNAGTNYKQTHLAFGRPLDAESTGETNKRFTSYDRSNATKLDYAINRTYDSKQGRFTQVDPIGMQAASLANPQSLNMYTYCGNDPVNFTDPTGLFWGWLKKLFRAIINFFRTSRVARRIAIKFVVSLVVSRGNFGVAIRSVVPDILAALGLAPPRYAVTPSWNPDLPYPINFGGISALSRYIIVNLRRALSNCFTYEWLVNQSKIQGLFDEAWEKSKKSGAENGGWILYEPKTNTVFVEWASEGSPPVAGQELQMPKEPGEFSALMTDLKKQGRSLILIAQFHTHPRSGENPHPSGADILNIGSPNKIAAQDKIGGINGTGDGSALGIIIGASRRYAYYSNSGEIHAGLLSKRCW